MSTENKIQEFVHKLEEGGWAKWITRSTLATFIFFITSMWYFGVTVPFIGKGPNGFKGLGHDEAMDQAQIAREITRGNGFSTKTIRPAALYQFESNRGAYPNGNIPDTYHAPLNPLLLAAVFSTMDTLSDWCKHLGNHPIGVGPISTRHLVNFTYNKQMDAKTIVFAYDKMVAVTQHVCYLLSLIVIYLSIRRLFDQRLAVHVTILLVLCQRFWDFGLSGLPQMLLLLEFSVAVYLLIRAAEAKQTEKAVWPWMIGIGICFGLLALTHAITIWIFIGMLIFAGFYFTPRFVNVGILLAVFAVFYVPWMVRNANVSGNAFGVSWYSGLTQVRGSQGEIMRSLAPAYMKSEEDFVSLWYFRQKLQVGTLEQFEGIYGYLGSIIVAPLFFVALMHLFKRREISDLRWGILLLWLFAVLGMAGFGLEGTPSVHPFLREVKANDIHILFVPIMTAYGLAFILTLWSRLEIFNSYLKNAFLGLLYFISALPFMGNMIDLNKPPLSPIQWPPYAPLYMSSLTEWTRPDEIVSSDVPWGVAWYCDRKSLWLPMSIPEFIKLKDYRSMGDIAGIYLTPRSCNEPYLDSIETGEFRAWAPFITRRIDVRGLRDFPLRTSIPMPLDNKCIFYSDRDRWTQRED